MPSYSDLLRLTLQNAGENESTWGDVANAVFDLLEDAIAGLTSVSVTSGDATLSALNGTADQSRRAIIEVTGNPGVARNVNVPALTKCYVVNNRTTGGQNVTIKTAAGTGVLLPANVPYIVYCDGSNVYGVGAAVATLATSATSADTATNALSLGGYVAASYPRLAAANTFTAAQSVQRVALTSAASITINAALSNCYSLTALQNFTLANPTGGTDGETLRVVIKQGAGGPYTITFGSKWVFPSGAVPALTATVGARDYLAAEYYAADDVWLAAMNRDMKV